MLGGWKYHTVLYCGVVFVVSWSLWYAAGMIDDTTWNISFLFFHLEIPQSSALTVLGNLVPGLVAVIIVLIVGGKECSDYFSQLRIPRCSGLLYSFAVLAPVIVVLLMFLAQEGLKSNTFASLKIADLARLFLVNILLAPLWEELGWRGFLLPAFSTRFRLDKASLLVACIWAGWHFMLYHSVFRISVYSYFISAATIIPMGVVLAFLYSVSGNKLLLPVLFHGSWNATTSWVTQIGVRYVAGPVVLEAVVVWALAFVAWFWWCRMANRNAPCDERCLHYTSGGNRL